MEKGKEMQMTAKTGPINAGELQVNSQIANKLQEIQGAMVMAKQFPRDYNSVWEKLMLACRRKTLAEKATYSFPRGGSRITGPSVNIARVAAQCYGNIRFGFDIERDDDESMSIKGWAWDLETNNKVEYPARFKKLILRKGKGWIKPDERDLRELVFREAAKLIRNSIFGVVPGDLVEDAVNVCVQTLTKNIEDPASEAKKIIIAYQKFKVTTEMLNRYLGTDEWTADELVELRSVLNALGDGASSVRDYFKPKDDKEDKPDKTDGSISLDKMTEGDHNTHVGYEKTDDKPAPADKPPEEKSEKEDEAGEQTSAL